MSDSDGDGPELIGVRHGMFGAKGTGDTSGYGRLIRPVALPGSSPDRTAGYFDEVVDALAAALGDDGFAAAIERVVVFRDELTFEVHRDQLPRWHRHYATTRRCDSSSASASAVCTIPTTRVANCTRCTR